MQHLTNTQHFNEVDDLMSIGDNFFQAMDIFSN
jgi:hypothetical protein